MNRIREIMAEQKWIGWAVVAALILIAALMLIRPTKRVEPYSPERMTRQVTIRFTDTKDEVKMRWGEIETELRRRPGTLKPDEGVNNPKTGKPTGFSSSESEWRDMIDRINEERADAGKAKSGGPR